MKKLKTYKKGQNKMAVENFQLYISVSFYPWYY